MRHHLKRPGLSVQSVHQVPLLLKPCSFLKRNSNPKGLHCSRGWEVILKFSSQSLLRTITPSKHCSMGLSHWLVGEACSAPHEEVPALGGQLKHQRIPEYKDPRDQGSHPVLHLHCLKPCSQNYKGTQRESWTTILLQERKSGQRPARERNVKKVILKNLFQQVPLL